MNQPPQPEISFFRTKRFWFRRAIPGLLLALWMVSMIFSQSIWIGYGAPSVETTYSLSLTGGSLQLGLKKLSIPRRLPIKNPWSDLSSEIVFHPRLRFFPPLFAVYGAGCLGQGNISLITIPLWPLLASWLWGMMLWSRHQKRTKAAPGST
ncbi:MAG: hypothetical protein CFE44_10315 [Burkholderiales bacterium PBB4]|nr:MAG: hypothetical protein CFE44_10315 [Burkholderiales bacterium PBB4]